MLCIFTVFAYEPKVHRTQQPYTQLYCHVENIFYIINLERTENVGGCFMESVRMPFDFCTVSVAILKIHVTRQNAIRETVPLFRCTTYTDYKKTHTQSLVTEVDRFAVEMCNALGI